MTERSTHRASGGNRPPGRPSGAWRRLTGWLLVLTGAGMVLSGLSAVLHH
ncbi:MAG TPA: hypothetical protein VE084_13675 [Burkholderiaceae bacterium]|nr:hypothetical protein [Burkholderiaceae bacterium]